MTLVLGSTQINNMYLGGTSVDKAYLGETLVFGAEEPAVWTINIQSNGETIMSNTSEVKEGTYSIFSYKENGYIRVSVGWYEASENYPARMSVAVPYADSESGLSNSFYQMMDSPGTVSAPYKQWDWEVTWVAPYTITINKISAPYHNWTVEYIQDSQVTSHNPELSSAEGTPTVTYSYYNDDLKVTIDPSLPGEFLIDGIAGPFHINPTTIFNFKTSDKLYDGVIKQTNPVYLRIELTPAESA